MTQQEKQPQVSSAVAIEPKRPELTDRARVDRLRQMGVATPLTADQVFLLRVDAGLEWLRWHAGHDQAHLLMLRGSPIFWQWVCTIWDLTDLMILTGTMHGGARMSADYYYRLHEEKLCQMYPSTGLIKLIKHQHKINQRAHETTTTTTTAVPDHSKCGVSV